MKASNHNNELKNFIQIISPWLAFSASIHRPQTEAEYDNLVTFLDHLLDLPPTWKTPQIEQLIHYIGTLIEEYDQKHYSPQLKTTGVTVLKFLMEQHNLKQSDLPEIGAQSIVSEILNGKRKLNIHHIKALSKRFDVNPDVFIDDV
jgi:HTH-type transcriptional regulator/antitoxin HigA